MLIKGSVIMWFYKRGERANRHYFLRRLIGSAPYFASIVASNHSEIITPPAVLNFRDVGVFLIGSVRKGLKRKKIKNKIIIIIKEKKRETRRRVTNRHIRSGSAEYYFSEELFFHVRTHVTKANACALRLIGKCFEKYEPFNYFEP